MVIFRQNDVAIYCCKLSKIEISLEEQLEHLKKYCKHFGFNIVQEYIDTDNVNKPQFHQMVENVRTKAFNIVLFYSFDTLTKNDDDLYKLLNELDKYNCELHLENSYKYKEVAKPLFKLKREDTTSNEKSMPKKKRKAKFYPIFSTHEIKNPQSEEPYNWVELLNDDMFRFDEFPIFDSSGNYFGISRDVYVVFKEITGFGRIKLTEEEKKNKEEKEKTKLKPKK